MASGARPVGDFTRKVAREIRARRSGARIEQGDFSDRAQIPVSTLSQIERERAPIDLEQLARIAGAFGTSPDKILVAAERNADIYNPDGTLNPAETRFSEADDEDVAEASAILSDLKDSPADR